MTPFLNIHQEISGISIIFFASLLVLFQFDILLETIYKTHQKKRILFASANMIFNFILLVILFYCVDEEKHPIGTIAPERHDFSCFLLNTPWIVYVASEVFSAVLMLLQLKSIHRYFKNHLTVNAIKETLDYLPAAVCICDKQGTVFLSNLKMDEFSKALTNHHLYDSCELWEKIVQQGKKHNEGYLFCSDDIATYLFTKKQLTLCENGIERQFERIIASDMTEIYHITQELVEKNKSLKEVQSHIREIAEYKRSLAASKEAMNARVAVHNQMGSVLLSCKYYMDHPQSMDEEELLHLLEYNNCFLLNKAEQLRKKNGPVFKSLDIAKQIGVNVKIYGIIPDNEPFCEVLAEAIEQCSANTVRHAEGDSLTVKLNETETQFIAELSNNGKPPEKEAVESGGLLYLRKAAEEINGTIKIQSQPVFRLSLYIPRQNT